MLILFFLKRIAGVALKFCRFRFPVFCRFPFPKFGGFKELLFSRIKNQLFVVNELPNPGVLNRRNQLFKLEITAGFVGFHKVSCSIWFPHCGIVHLRMKC